MTKQKENNAEIDYEKIGFMCGLEIHQQLETNNLFCSCPSIVHDKNPSIVAVRKLKAVVGETGVIDRAAAHEQSKSKEMVYEGCAKSYCLVELDEEPPGPINNEAVESALIISKMLNSEIVDEVQIMRKTVVDGSNVGGFQRTALIGMNGFIETSLGKVRVSSVCVEEEASKKVRGKEIPENIDKENQEVYRLDRLGVCLVEIATEPDVKNAEHAQECAEILGMILRSTGKVKRGIGTIRQDVNVSIKGGKRVEIKGFQDLKSIPKVVNYEIKRQQELIANKEEVSMEVRRAEPDMTTSFMRPMPGAARMYPETDVLPLVITDDMIEILEIPGLISEKKQKLIEEYSLDEGLVKDILNKGYDFEMFVSHYGNLEPKYIASVLVQVVKELRRKEKLDVEKLTVDDFKEVLALVNEDKVPKTVAGELLAKKIKGEDINLNDYKGVDDSLVEAEIAKMIAEKPGMNMGAYMGLVMAKFQGKVDGKKASGLIAKLLK